MDSITVKPFWKLFANLPLEIKNLSKDTYKNWKEYPSHPSIHFEKIKSIKKYNAYSVRIGLNYRALCYVENNTAYWFWIGSHEEYNKIIKG